jgi:hypothetical protein
MARKFSVVCLIFGIVNILVALVPPGIQLFGVIYVISEPPWPVERVDIGPPIWQHVRKDLPAYKAEVIGSAVCSSFLSLLLIGGAVGLFMNHDWGRWLSIGAAVIMIFTFCIHDVYQLAVVRPSLAPVVARHFPPGPPGHAEGGQVGFAIVFFFWCWANLLLIVYLLAMSVTLALTRAFGGSPVVEDRLERFESRRRRDDD